MLAGDGEGGVRDGNKTVIASEPLGERGNLTGSAGAGSEYDKEGSRLLRRIRLLAVTGRAQPKA